MPFYTCIYKQNKWVKSRRKQLKEFILSISRIKTFKLLITHSQRRFEWSDQASSVISFSPRHCFHCYYLVQVAVENIRFVKFQIIFNSFSGIRQQLIIFLTGNIFHKRSFYINLFQSRVTFLYPLKTSENLWFSGGIEM